MRIKRVKVDQAKTLVADAPSAEYEYYEVKDDVLGTGGTARVWRGVRERDGLEVAVKIAYPEKSTRDVELFWDELRILQQLNPHGDKGHVPWAHKGFCDQAPDANIIVMELIPEDWVLLRVEGTEQLSEARVLETGAQYAELLETMHANGISMRGDRKASDLRWGPPAAPRLVVLDYNRAQDFPKDAEGNINKILRAEFIHQDIRDFGRLWSALALGKNISAAPPIDEAEDAEWNALTRGTRVIFARSLGSRAHYGYGSAHELQRALETHARRFKRWKGAEFDALVKEAEELRRSSTDLDTQIANAGEILNLLDLIQSADSATAKHFVERIQILEKWAKDQASQARLKTGSAVQRIQDQIKLEAYERAAEIATNTLTEMQGNGLELRRAQLRLLRWQTIANVGVEGNRSSADKSGMDMHGVMINLADSGRHIDSAAFNIVSASTALNLAQTAFQKAEESLPRTFHENLKPLELEMQVRIAVANAKFDAAQKEWQELGKIARAKIARWDESLRADLPEFDDFLSRIDIKTEEGKDLAEILQRANSDFEALVREM